MAVMVVAMATAQNMAVMKLSIMACHNKWNYRLQKLRTVLTAADLRPQTHGFATIAACPSSLLNAALAINR